MKRILLLLFGFLAMHAYAQPKMGKEFIDSLTKELNSTSPPKADSLKTAILVELCFDYYAINPDKGIQYGLQGLEIAQNSNLKNQASLAYNYLGANYCVKGDYPNAFNCWLKSLSLSEELGNKKRVASTSKNIGRIYVQQKDINNALKYYNNALAIYEEIKDTMDIPPVWGDIGSAYAALDNYPLALEYYYKALEKNKKYSNKIYTINNIGNIGLVLMEQGKDYQGALENLFLALKMNEEIGDVYNSLINLGNIGLSYLSIAKDTTGKIKRSDLIPFGKAANLSKSIEYFDKCIALCKKTSDLYNFEVYSEKVSQAHELVGNYKSALENYKQYVKAKDSVFNIANNTKITNLETKRAVELKDKQIEIDKLEVAKKKNERWFLMAGIGGLLVIVTISIRNNRKQKVYTVLLQKEKEQVSAEKENAVQQRLRAEQSEAFKQQFLANMSHEIRTPMNAVMGMTSLALDTGVPEKQKMYLEGIKKSSDNLLHIINDILDLSKIEAGKMELEEIDFSLAGTLEQVKQVLSYRAEEKGLQLITYIDPAVPDVAIGDPVRLGQALLNLAGNGIKFTEQGSVSIEVKQLTEGVRFSVTDTGIGIPRDKLELVFEKFSQANSSDTRKFGGTGLGLSISQQLVELMGGHIGIESEEGSGTTFSFILNLPIGSEERLKQRLAAEEDVDGSALNGLSILVVDDNEYNRIVARDTLEAKAKVKIDTVASAKEGLALLQQKHYDVVLMDVQMPVMNGFDATRYIREQMDVPVKNIPVIALTASVLRTDLDKCKAAGMNLYVSKPFKASQLIGAIAEVLGLSGGTKRPAPVIVKGVAAGTVTDLTYLTTYCESDKDRIAGYVKMYLKAAAGFEEKARAAIASCKAEDAAALAHAFKPKWTMMGMAQSIDLGQKIEYMSKELGNEPHIKKSLEELIVYNNQSIIELQA